MEAKTFILLVSLCAASMPALATERAQADYMVHCQGCHLPDGSGFPARGVPDMRDVLRPFAQIKEGRGYLVQVPGSSLSSLSDQQLTDLLNWGLEDLARGPAEAAPYTVEEVTHWRGILLEDPGAMRTQLLEQISAAAND